MKFTKHIGKTSQGGIGFKFTKHDLLPSEEQKVTQREANVEVKFTKHNEGLRQYSPKFNA